MKKIFSNIKVYALAIFISWLSAPSCSDFLDVVPDNVFQYEDFFNSQQQAYNALATLYTMLPGDNRELFWTLGDEYALVVPPLILNRASIPGQSIMRGNQSATNPLLDYWNGGILVAPYNIGTWVIIRECDKFILNIDNVPDMSAEMKADWKAQAKFLKAYYMFMLVQMYGPIIIPEYFDENGNINDDPFYQRRKVEDCFDYIIALMNEAIPYLRPKRETLYLGQPDQVAAKAIKARVLLVRASPFFNGNYEYYHNFLDHNGEHFFSQTEDREKWKAAADATQEALDACEQYGFRLHHFKGIPYDFDFNDFQINPQLQTMYDLLFRITERWNEELIWGWVRGNITWSNAAMIVKPPELAGPAPANQATGWAQSSYQVMERYYTKNGLPLNEDRTVKTGALHEIVTTPEETDLNYEPMRGIMQPGTTTINMYLDREPRFYADLGVTGSYYRSHQLRIPIMMFQNTWGGYLPEIQTSYVPSSGIAIQKIVHPEAYHSSNISQTLKLYPNPIMRVADLYLMQAEALNEYYGPSQEVYDAINTVRLRAGIPSVEESYSNLEWVTEEAYNKHLTKEGMRDIILHERAIEFAFENAHRFWDMQRWKRSTSEFSRPLYGWNFRGTSAESFFVLRNIQGRAWGITESLWPINSIELERNTKLIQNPGW